MKVIVRREERNVRIHQNRRGKTREREEKDGREDSEEES